MVGGTLWTPTIALLWIMYIDTYVPKATIIPKRKYPYKTVGGGETV